jgi:2-oxoglutarate dehydrogenase complex dehydrogenase (E1) component-like enzyme
VNGIIWLKDIQVFDLFMAKKYPGVKRYGLEGAESLLVALDILFKQSSHGKWKLYSLKWQT